MNNDTKKKLNELIEAEEWEEVVETVERIPEAEWDWETIGMYIRSLNNGERIIDR